MSGVPLDVWLSYRANAGVERLATGPAALSNLPAIEGLNRDMMRGFGVISIRDVEEELGGTVDDSDWYYVSNRANGKTQARLHAFTSTIHRISPLLSPQRLN